MNNWLTIKQAAFLLNQKLGGGYCESSIRSRIRGQEWKAGKEYVDDRRVGARNPRYKINVKFILDSKGVEIE